MIVNMVDIKMFIEHWNQTMIIKKLLKMQEAETTWRPQDLGENNMDSKPRRLLQIYFVS
jgi:hypothetical protein